MTSTTDLANNRTAVKWHPPLRLRRLAALRVVLHPFRAARALGALADEAATRDLMYRTALKLAVWMELGPRQR